MIPRQKSYFWVAQSPEMNAGWGERKANGSDSEFRSRTAKRFVLVGVYMKMKPVRFHTNWSGPVSMRIKA